MKRTLALLGAVVAAATLASACGFQHQQNVLAPTSTDTSGDKGNLTPSLLGTWASQNVTVPTSSSCSNFQWMVTSQTTTTMTGDFSVECAGGITVSGSASGQLNGTSVPMTATGSASLPGIPSCAFSLTGTGTIVDDHTLTVPYNGSTCLGPVQGTETLRKRSDVTSQQPVIGQPQPLSPASNERVSSRRPTFTFANASRSSAVGAITYDLEISESYSFSPTYAVLTVGEQANTTSVQLPEDGPYAKYFFWRVRAKDATTTGPWGGPQAFMMPDEVVVVVDDPLLGCGGLVGDKTQLVTCIHDRLNAPHTVEGAFDATKRIAWALRGEGGGLLIKNSGENTVSWQGYNFSAGRISYPDGHIYKVLTDVPTTNGPQWADNGFVDRSLYVPAIDPRR